MRSLREGLQRRLMGALTALFAVLALGLYLVTRHLLVAQFDATLEAKARVLATLVKRAPDGQMDVDLAEEPMPEFERRREPEYYELTDLDGRSIARSRSRWSPYCEMNFWSRFCSSPESPLARAISARCHNA